MNSVFSIRQVHREQLKRLATVVAIFYVVNSILWGGLAVWLFGIDPAFVALTAVSWPWFLVDGMRIAPFEWVFTTVGMVVALYWDHRHAPRVPASDIPDWLQTAADWLAPIALGFTVSLIVYAAFQVAVPFWDVQLVSAHSGLIGRGLAAISAMLTVVAIDGVPWK